MIKQGFKILINYTFNATTSSVKDMFVSFQDCDFETRKLIAPTISLQYILNRKRNVAYTQKKKYNSQFSLRLYNETFYMCNDRILVQR